MRTMRTTMLVLSSISAACQCAEVAGTDADTDLSASSTSSMFTSVSSSTSDTSESSTGEPFDASQWVGMYHYENPFMTFGEPGDPQGSRMLANFEIFADSRATMFYDHCSLDEPITIQYTWESEAEGWLRLLPGAGETSLRYASAENVKSLAVQRTEPAEMCRPRLVFELDGIQDGFAPFYPGESCWVNRCTESELLILADYCEGEEPPPCA